MNKDWAGATRRRFVKGTSIAVAAAIAGPFISRTGLASSGELKFMGWAGYDFQPAFAAFEKASGVKVTFVAQPDQDAMLAQGKLGGAGAYDIVEPTADRLRNWVDQEFLQPIDESRADFAGIDPSFINGRAGAMQTMAGKRYGSPSLWGTEGLCFNKESAPLEYGTASLGTLWDQKYANAVTVRPHSGLSAIGRWLEAEGKLPKPFDQCYTDPAVMDQNYQVILKKAIEVKPSIAQFWKDENSAQGAFRTNGCVIGVNWDTTAAALMKEELPIGFLAPKEGAFAWMQNIALFKGARNVEQAYAFMKWLNSPDGSAMWAQAYASNPCAKGAIDKMPAASASFVKAAYPGDALQKLWWWPATPSWFITKRNEYADKFQAA